MAKQGNIEVCIETPPNATQDNPIIFVVESFKPPKAC